MRPATKQRALDKFRSAGGLLRTREALKLGIHPRELEQLVKGGEITKITRGLYRLTELPPLSNPDLVTVAKTIPKAIIFLISALAFHGLTAEIPHEVYIALPHGSEAPRVSFPPIRIFRSTKQFYEAGVEKHLIDGVTVKVYSAEKTIVDCFRYRNKIGLDVAVEALKNYISKKGKNLTKLYAVARATRVGAIIKPYLEALS